MSISQGDDQRKLNEETLTQLQQDYNNLLKKYAEAENTIDSLRIGAKIPIQIEVSGNGAGSTGGLPSPAATGPRRSSVISSATNLAQGEYEQFVLFFDIDNHSWLRGILGQLF